MTLKCQDYTLHALQPVKGKSNAPLGYNNHHKLQHTSLVIHTHTHPSTSLISKESSLHACITHWDVTRFFSVLQSNCRMSFFRLRKLWIPIQHSDIRRPV